MRVALKWKHHLTKKVCAITLPLVEPSLLRFRSFSQFCSGVCGDLEPA